MAGPRLDGQVITKPGWPAARSASVCGCAARWRRRLACPTGAKAEQEQMVPRGRSFDQRLAELLDPLQALLDIGHAGGVADADVIVRAESDAGNGGHFLRFEQPGAELGGLEAGLRDVREEVEGALGIDAGNAGDAVELLPGVACGAWRIRPATSADDPAGRSARRRRPFGQSEVGLLVLWLWMALMALAMGSGAAHQPSRQPVMLQALAKPCTMMVCSKCAGEKLATLLWSRHRRAGARKSRRS